MSSQIMEILRPSQVKVHEMAGNIISHREANGGVITFYTQDGLNKILCIDGKDHFTWLLSAVQENKWAETIMRVTTEKKSGDQTLFVSALDSVGEVTEYQVNTDGNLQHTGNTENSSSYDNEVDQTRLVLRHMYQVSDLPANINVQATIKGFFDMVRSGVVKTPKLITYRHA